MPASPNDLTQRPPRSARVRLGGYAILPRCLDKGRATVNGKNGEYHFNCPLDQMFLTFAGIDAEELKSQLTLGKSDTEILEWIQANAKNKPAPYAIHAWSAWVEQRVPTEVEGREYFHTIHKSAGPNRKDIGTWFDVLDMDDYASYGGKA
jgi:hypothetical protein